MTSVKNEIINYSGETFTLTTYNDISIIKHNKSNYYNASRVCRQTNKLLKDWFNNKDTKLLLNEVSEELNLPILEENSMVENFPPYGNSLIYQLGSNYNPEIRGYYVHPELIHYICNWCNRIYARKVARIMNIVNEELQLKNIDLNDKVNEMSIELNELKNQLHDNQLDNERLTNENKRLLNENELLQSKSSELETQNSNLETQNKQLTVKNIELIDDDKRYAVPKNHTSHKMLSIIRLDKMDKQNNSFRLSSDSTQVKLNNIRVKGGTIIARYSFPASLNARQTIKGKLNLTSYRFKFKLLPTIVNEIHLLQPTWTKESHELNMILHPEVYQCDTEDLEPSSDSPDDEVIIDLVNLDNGVTDDVSELNDMLNEANVDEK